MGKLHNSKRDYENILIPLLLSLHATLCLLWPPSLLSGHCLEIFACGVLISWSLTAFQSVTLQPFTFSGLWIFLSSCPKRRSQSSWSQPIIHLLLHFQRIHSYSTQSHTRYIATHIMQHLPHSIRFLALFYTVMDTRSNHMLCRMLQALSMSSVIPRYMVSTMTWC